MPPLLLLLLNDILFLTMYWVVLLSMLSPLPHVGFILLSASQRMVDELSVVVWSSFIGGKKKKKKKKRVSG